MEFERVHKFIRKLLYTWRRGNDIVSSWLNVGRACQTCGFVGRPLRSRVLWPELVKEWGLPPEWRRWMDEREGTRCAWCGSNLRCEQLAGAIVAAVNSRCGSSAKHLRGLFRDMHARSLAIAEINSAGNLHRYLKRCVGLRHSEFGSHSPDLPSEDLMRLTYADAAFDLVITSETLEHVPDIDAALHEIYRVLKPGGVHIFTVPIVWGRPTRQRTQLRDGKLVYLLPPSYHGAPQDHKTDLLVFYEFGSDFVDRCQCTGFKVDLLRDPENPALVTIIACKQC